ncbi:Wzz/FepE/Etk N-terminal domain-containing protein [Shewanella benthica]|uniref:exopolysaccharide transport family protein n=1 Tax=Shewanella benthica TaxID=43661 RepID=UPI0018796A55|nr:Wzz/FepE/Etk N-terminal domain-containing protein [Shewanella benthica]MBE7216332.1 hypothetical protein [Shewanella benthica]MCL1064609.1 Wzz/FepE/Etk N-terminal domain-containing protein [Shewanella benthica]
MNSAPEYSSAEDDQTETAGLKIDLELLWSQVKGKIWLPFLVAILCGAVTLLLTKYFIKDSWKANTIIIRHQKNMSSQADIPYLYLQIDFNTIMQTILVRDHLLRVIERLELSLTPEDLYKNIIISRGNRSDIINITAIWHQPEMAVKMSDAVSAVFLESYSSVQNSAAQKVNSYFLNELSTSRKALIAAQQAESDFRQKHKLLSFDNQMASNYQKIQTLEIKYIESQVATDEKRAKLKATIAKLTTIPKQIPLETMVAGAALNRINGLRENLQLLKLKYTSQNPKVMAMEQKIATLQINSDNTSVIDQVDTKIYGQNPLYLELELEMIHYEFDLYVSDQSLAGYRLGINNTKDSLQRLSALRQEHQRHQDQMIEYRQLVSTLEGRVTDSKLALESNISDFEIIENALPPKYPERAYRKLMAITAGVFGFTVSALILIAIVLFDPRVKTRNDLDLKRLIGVLPDKDTVEECHYYSAFQGLFSNLEQLRSENGNQSKLITLSSTHQHEGKSTIAHSLTDIYLRQGKRVLYIESVEEGDGVDEAVLNPFIYGKESRWQPLNVADSIDHAYFVYDQDIYLNYLDKASFDITINTISQDYDVVIWELFPAQRHLQLYSVINNSPAAILLIAKSLFTRKDNLNRVSKYLSEKNIKPIGIILTQVPKDIYHA